MSNEMETRTVNSPRTGTKVSLIVAACALAVAVYFYTASTNFQGKDGGIFGCGSPMSPNNNALGKSQCHIIESAGLHKAILFLAIALICAILGTLLFGMDKRTQERGARTRLDDEHDDDDAEDREHAGRRSGMLAGRQDRRASSRHDDERRQARRPRLGDEDHEDDEPRRSRSTRLSEREDDVNDRRDETESRPRRRGSRYDADAFDNTRD